MGQVILLRELNVALYGVELIYILAMAVWLLWSAVGAMIGPRFRVPEKSTVGWALFFSWMSCSSDIFGTLPGLSPARFSLSLSSSLY